MLIHNRPLTLIATISGLMLLGGCAETVVHNKHQNPSSNLPTQSTQHGSDPEWNRGCNDAKHNHYDTDRHPQAYKDGHRSCENIGGDSSSSDPSEKKQGCNDAKRGYYDQSKHTQLYKDGHRACEVSSHHANAGSSTPQDLADLVNGHRLGSEVDDEISRRGYHHLRNQTSGQELWSYWKKTAADYCVVVHFKNSHVASIMKATTDCHK